MGDICYDSHTSIEFNKHWEAIIPALGQINISLQGIGHAISDNLVAVPMYQRSYAWEERHVNDLYHDIATAIAKKEDEYFLGSIVVTSETSDRPEVVDGQQRLATVTILLAAIRDWFYTKGDIDRAKDIESTYLAKRDFRTQEMDSLIRMNEVDQDYYSKRILTNPDDPLRATGALRESHERINKAAELAKAHVNHLVELTGDPVENLAIWIEYLKIQAKVIWVNVPTYADAFTIFETLNDRGLDLAISDLLKNHLFRMSADRILEAQQRWVSMYGTLEAVGGEIIALDYIRHLWSSKNGLTRERELYDNIKNAITSKQSAIDFSGELSENANNYAALINPSHEFWNDYGSTARENMSTINLLRMVQIRPLLLAVLSTFSIDETKKILPVMISWGVRFLVFGGVGGGVLERHYSDRAKEIRNGTITNAQGLIEAMKGVVPTDREFESAFSTARVSIAAIARYYLRALEKQTKGEPNPELVPNINEEIVNLEHILPEHASAAWAAVDAETASAYHKRVGNLALLQNKVNLAVGNDGFEDKIPYYAESLFVLTSSIPKYGTWGPQQIEERQKELAAIAVLTWPNKIP